MDLSALKEQMTGLDLRTAAGVIADTLVDASLHQRAVLASAYKEANPGKSWDDIFAIFEYEPTALKSVAYAICEYHHVMKGDRGHRVMLGWDKIDELLRGIRPGQVCGFGARASVGKTTFACNLIANIFTSSPHPILFFSLEMPAAEIAARLFAIDQKIYPSHIERYFTASCEDPSVASWASKYSDLVIVDEGALSIEMISAKYDEACHYLGRAIPLIVIDYQGCIKGKGGSAYERASDIAMSLKALAKAKSTAIFTLIQLSRKGGDGTERVTMDMARDSGQIEEACDFLLGAWRPKMTKQLELDEFKISILKNRHGRMGDFDMIFDSRFLRIKES